jgi:predicted dehydrogenase
MSVQVVSPAAPVCASLKPTDAPVRIAVVGLNFGRYMVDELLGEPARQHCQLMAVCDTDAARTARVVEKTGLPAHSRLEDLLADPSVEAIGLFCGPVGRAKLIRQIIRAGKHVMTTKPFELDAVAARDVLEEARQLGRVVHLNSPSPLPASDLRQVQLWQQELELGRPIACRRDVWASYREQADGSWYDDPTLCPVAPIFRLGIYLINDMVRLFGAVEAVQVMHSRLLTGRPTPDTAQLSLRFANGMLGNIFASFSVGDGQFYGNSMVINYENGTIYRNVGPAAYGPAHRRRIQMSVVAGHPKMVTDQAEPKDASGEYQWDAFQHAVRRGIALDVPTSDLVVAGIKVINAMARAERSGVTEKV